MPINTPVSVDAPVPPLPTLRVPVRDNVDPLPFVVSPVVPPLNVTTPEVGVMLPESPSIVVIAPLDEMAWKVGELVPLEVSTYDVDVSFMTVRFPVLSHSMT